MRIPSLPAKTDAEMISTMSVANYFKYIFFTFAGKGQGDRVRR
jgi:O-antigen biosynthesis protein WbqP